MGPKVMKLKRMLNQKERKLHHFLWSRIESMRCSHLIIQILNIWLHGSSCCHELNFGFGPRSRP